MQKDYRTAVANSIAQGEYCVQVRNQLYIASLGRYFLHTKLYGA